METTHQQHLARGEDEIEVTVTCRWSHNPGEYIEHGHRFNGYGRGWECDEITAVDATGKPVALTDREREYALEQGAHERETANT